MREPNRAALLLFSCLLTGCISSAGKPEVRKFYAITVTGSDGKPCQVVIKQDTGWSGNINETTCPAFRTDWIK